MARKRSRRRELTESHQQEPEGTSPSSLTGNFRKHASFRSLFLSAQRDVLIYLPPSYEEEPERRFPVLYLHDGQNVFDGATSFTPGDEWQVDESAQRMIEAGEIEPLIAVAIYNTGPERIAEYTPSRDIRYRGSGKGDRYGRFLVEELKPFVDKHYRTASGAGDTALCGSSLGGLITMYLGLKYPQTFGKLAVLSPAAWWNRRMIVRFVNKQPKTQTRIWLDIGTAEGENALRNARLLKNALVKRGWTEGEDLTYLEAEGAGHTESAWAYRMPYILRFLFPVS
ncbi:MAG: alpha/beta hydrolase-fold protein [Acidobacteriota bacterium]